MQGVRYYYIWERKERRSPRKKKQWASRLDDMDGQRLIMKFTLARCSRRYRQLFRDRMRPIIEAESRKR